MSKLEKARSRLGRGLSSLISIPDLPIEGAIGETQAPSSEVAAGSPLPGSLAVSPEIPIDQVSPNPHQPRRDFDEKSLGELAASLKTNGLIQPIIVRSMEGGYQLVAGERRLRAAKLA